MSQQEIRMVIATGIYPPSIGGPASYSKLLVDKFGPYGYQMKVVTFDSVRKYPKGISHIVYFLKLLRASINFDTLYVMDPVSVGLPAAFVAFLTRKPFVLRLGGDYAWEQGTARFNVTDTLDDFVMNRQPNLQVRILQKIESFVARRARAVVVPSKYLKLIIEKWNVSEERIKVIYNAFEAPALDQIPARDDTDTVSIISVGRLVAWKGFKELMTVVDELVKEGNKISLSIAGDGPLKKELQEYIDHLNASEHIKLLGALSKTDLHTKMLQSDVFALYTGYEGFSHLVLEAMSLGLPIVTTRVGGNSEILRDNENALLIDRNRDELKDAIVRMVADKSLRERISKQAKQDVGEFTNEKMFGELDEVLRKSTE